ncbi:MAG: phosphoribosylformylglycinamidine synthase subunit PurS [Firmicutes bacterium]|jgi:phosphoribosylformylglycinamidine synthase|nr:phosphoribosylformylglycinamidine synthase subunit PurS [Bacillota bacterium]HOB22694.1 phosphoribosylformylglycinamidine synthase subunit PurS [Bacillota bacterium]HQD39155.1 phosphoribosylformylglycinamidine synthase subunit PurS [Bacillota bacterium]
MWKAEIRITLKEGVVDPQGKAVEKTLGELGYSQVEQVQIGKYVELVVNTPQRAEADRQVDEICRKVLINPVLEEYTYQLVEVL